MLDYLMGILEFALKAFKMHADSAPKVSVRAVKEKNTDGVKETMGLHAENLTIGEAIDFKNDFSFDFRESRIELNPSSELDELEHMKNDQSIYGMEDLSSTDDYFDVIDTIDFQTDPTDDST